MDPDALVNAACRDLFEFIIDTLSRTQDDYTLTD